MNNSLRSTLLSLALIAALLTSCSEADDVVSGMLFETKPDIVENLNFSVNRVNAWIWDANSRLYGADVFVFNDNDISINRISIKIKSVSPTTYLQGFSQDNRDILNLPPKSSRRSEAHYVQGSTYVGNFFVFLSSTIPGNTPFTVTFEVTVFHGSETYNFDIEETFRATSSYSSF